MCSQALWRRIWPILLTITGCRCCSSGASHQLAEHTLRGNGFTRIRKDAVAQLGSRPPTVTMTFFFFGSSLALESALELLLGPATELGVAGCCIKFTFHCTSQSD